MTVSYPSIVKHEVYKGRSISLCRKMRFIDFSCMMAIHTLTNIYTVVQYHDATLCEPSMQMACSDFMGYACCHSKWDLHVGCTHENDPDASIVLVPC